MFAGHGPVLRALADAATHDPRVEEAYANLPQGFVDATARHIEEEIAAGRVLPMVAETAKALVWMMERYLQHSLGRPPVTAPETVADTLTTIWSRVLYGSEAPMAGGG